MTMTETAEEDSQIAAENDIFLSPHEVKPKAAKPEAKEYHCPHCDKVYARGLDRVRKMNLDNHIRHAHKDAAPPKPKGTAKLPKAAAAVKAAGPEPATKKRKPAGDNLALGVGLLAQVAARAGYMPLGNALAFEAPAAGQALDVALAGSFIDRKLIQPLSSGAEKWQAVGDVVTLPLCVQLCAVYPQLRLALEPAMRHSVENILVLTVPTLRKKVDKDRKLAEALEELGHLDKTIADDPDPVGSILNGLLSETPEAQDAA